MKRLSTYVTKYWRMLALAAALLIGIVAGLTGLGVGLEQNLAEVRYGLRHHDAQSDIAIVEIDARSIAAIDRWPWPRKNYATLVDRLRSAGVASVAFDVDFSAPSDPAQDREFASALSRADGLVTVPTFRQAADNTPDGYIDSVPISALREHSLAATVNVRPDPDGSVRSAPLGEVVAGSPRPSLSAMIAGRSGTAGTSFPIDFAIDPSSIPRFSFIDVRDGKVAPSRLRGKRIVVGATAVEIGDRYAVPRYGVVPGVIIQALAALTLEQRVPRRAGWGLPLLLALLLACPMMFARSGKTLALAGLGAALSVLAAATFAGGIGWEVAIVPAMLSLLSVGAAATIAQINAWLSKRRAIDESTGLPNQHALLARLQGREGTAVAAVRIAEYDRLFAALGASAMPDLVCRLRDRISVLGGDIAVYRVSDRVLAWEATISAGQLAMRHEQLRSIMLSPIEVGGRKVDVAVTTGFAAQSGDPGQAIANAASAADLAAANGTGWHIYLASDTEAASADLALIGEIDDAIAAGHLFTVYQPKLDLRTNHIVSAEALVRWKHPERGMLPPDHFIPLLERADRIDGLTLHVISTAIADAKAWSAAGHRLTVAVNLSAILLESEPFLEQLEALLHESAIDPRLLTFEVTESAAMHAPEVAVAALLKFRELGVAISMDDYGTGQSTLTYLKRLPLDELKIDRSFVQFAHQSNADAVLVRSTINLAHELGLKVVAEGVETDDCLAFLKSAGCDLAQGYLVSPPVIAARITELVRSERRAAA